MHVSTVAYEVHSSSGKRACHPSPPAVAIIYYEAAPMLVLCCNCRGGQWTNIVQGRWIFIGASLSSTSVRTTSVQTPSATMSAFSGLITTSGKYASRHALGAASAPASHSNWRQVALTELMRDNRSTCTRSTSTLTMPCTSTLRTRDGMLRLVTMACVCLMASLPPLFVLHMQRCNARHAARQTTASCGRKFQSLRITEVGGPGVAATPLLQFSISDKLLDISRNSISLPAPEKLSSSCCTISGRNTGAMNTTALPVLSVIAKARRAMAVISAQPATAGPAPCASMVPHIFNKGGSMPRPASTVPTSGWYVRTQLSVPHAAAHVLHPAKYRIPQTAPRAPKKTREPK